MDKRRILELHRESMRDTLANMHAEIEASNNALSAAIDELSPEARERVTTDANYAALGMGSVLGNALKATFFRIFISKLTDEEVVSFKLPRPVLEFIRANPGDDLPDDLRDMMETLKGPRITEVRISRDNVPPEVADFIDSLLDEARADVGARAIH